MKSTVRPSKNEPVIVVKKKGEWYRSEFPHPLVTIDFDKDGDVLEVSVLAVEELSWHEDPV